MVADLLPSSASGHERALSKTTGRRIEAIPVPLRALWNPDKCPVDLLPWQAWGLSVDFWSDNWPESVKREMYRNSILIHRYKGTPWAVKKALKIVGLGDSEIVERSTLLKKYDSQGGLRLDGSWRLGPEQRLSSFERLTGYVWPENWATFHVRLNMAQASKHGTLDIAQTAVEIAKPLRSWPLWNLFLSLQAGPVPDESKSNTDGQAGSVIPQPASLRLDGTWRLGTDATTSRLDGRPLNFRLGEIIPARITKRLKDDRLYTAAHGSKTLTIKPGEPNLKQEPLGRLSERTMRLDGSWNVGTGLTLDGSWNLSGETRLVEANRLGKLPDHRLDGTWRLGVSKPVCTTWPSVH